MSFSSPKLPEVKEPTPPPPPPPFIDEARALIDQKALRRKRRGRAANILVGKESGVATAKTNLGN